MKTLLKLLLATVITTSCSSLSPYSRDYFYYQRSSQDLNQQHYYFAQEYLRRLSDRPTVIVIEKKSSEGTSSTVNQPRRTGTRTYVIKPRQLPSGKGN
jgi:hypothetical protein